MHILIVEDEGMFAKAVNRHLSKQGYDCQIADTLAQASAHLASRRPDLILLDMRLPDGNGMDLLEALRKGEAADVPVVVLTAFGDLEQAVSAMKLNARDYLKKPIDLEELGLTVSRVLEGAKRDKQLAYSREREQHSTPNENMIGASESIVRIRQQIKQIASLAGTEQAPNVLIVGPTGTGKGLAARLLHEHSVRAKRPFVHVDCTALPTELAESELFGHKRGAFTSAVADRTGLIEAAEDGTVFLDEIGELPPEMQAKLLSVLERRQVRRVGSSGERPIRAWFVAATNRDLEAQIASGQFRADLFYRLKVLNIEMPALHMRGEDACLLAEHFAQATAKRFGVQAPTFNAQARAAIRAYAWPGNVRELAHLVERAVLLSEGEVLSPQALFGETPGPTPAVDQSADADASQTLEQAEAHLITSALARTNGNVSQAARELGVTRMTLRYRMKQHNITGKS